MEINSEYEHEFISESMKRYNPDTNPKRYFIGMEESRNNWVSGASVDLSKWCGSLTNDPGGHPILTNFSSSVNCWDAIPNGETAGYICEIDGEFVPCSKSENNIFCHYLHTQNACLRPSCTFRSTNVSTDPSIRVPL